MILCGSKHAIFAALQSVGRKIKSTSFYHVYIVWIWNTWKNNDLRQSEVNAQISQILHHCAPTGEPANRQHRRWFQLIPRDSPFLSDQFPTSRGSVRIAHACPWVLPVARTLLRDSFSSVFLCLSDSIIALQVHTVFLRIVEYLWPIPTICVSVFST